MHACIQFCKNICGLGFRAYMYRYIHTYIGRQVPAAVLRHGAAKRRCNVPAQLPRLAQIDQDAHHSQGHGGAGESAQHR